MSNINVTFAEMLTRYSHAVYMERWKQADYWWKAIRLLAKDQLK